jgi:hypothetical protein
MFTMSHTRQRKKYVQMNPQPLFTPRPHVVPETANVKKFCDELKNDAKFKCFNVQNEASKN